MIEKSMMHMFSIRERAASQWCPDFCEELIQSYDGEDAAASVPSSEPRHCC